jgi:3-oxoacyl-[acyl-carrier protein] reductase
VTGASRGLGIAIVKELLDGGYFVVGVARTKTSEIEAIFNSAQKENFAFESFDLSNGGLIKEFSGLLSSKYGRFYGLVNNAGLGKDGILSTMHEKDIADIYSVNLVAPTLLCKYISRGMLLNKEGRIINIASIIANTGFSGLSVYGASKAGLIGLTKSLSRELGKINITVNSISPGFLETNMTEILDEKTLSSIRKRSPFNRFTKVYEVAKTVKFLLSAEASGVHGTNLVVDLGSTA